MSKVFYRIVTEDFADEPGQRWPIDVLIQTEDPADFDRFEAAVEEALYRCAGVAEAAVIAVPHPKLGEDIGACVVPLPGTTLDTQALRAACAQILADNQVPRHWFVLRKLPRNGLGKVLKRELRAQVLAHQAPMA